MVHFVIVPTNLELWPIVCQQFKNKAWSELRRATITPQDKFRQMHVFLNFLDNDINTSQCSRSRMVIAFTDNANGAFHEIAVVIIVVDARRK